MTDRLTLPAASAQSSSIEARRVLARKAARRHSAIVRLLRRGMVGGAAVAVLAIAAVVVFDPFHASVHGASIEGAAIDGSKVTMTNPKLSGFEKDGRPYAIEAARAVQDLKVPSVFELYELKARLVMTDKTITHLTAALGSYNSAAETMTLGAGAHVVSENGLDAVTQDAVVEFKSNTLSTDKPVTVTMPGKRIAADRMVIREGGKTVTFDGHVHTDMVPVQRTAAVEGAGAAPAP